MHLVSFSWSIWWCKNCLAQRAKRNVGEDAWCLNSNRVTSCNSGVNCLQVQSLSGTQADEQVWMSWLVQARGSRSNLEQCHQFTLEPAYESFYHILLFLIMFLCPTSYSSCFKRWRMMPLCQCKSFCMLLQRATHSLRSSWFQTGTSLGHLNKPIQFPGVHIKSEPQVWRCYKSIYSAYVEVEGPHFDLNSSRLSNVVGSLFDTLQRAMVETKVSVSCQSCLTIFLKFAMHSCEARRTSAQPYARSMCGVWGVVGRVDQRNVIFEAMLGLTAVLHHRFALLPLT